MKRQLIAVIAVALLASVTAAMAKSTHKRPPPPPHPPMPSIASPEAKYPPTDPYAVWVAGTYVGRDPDPNVRSMMIREFYNNFDTR